MALEIKKKKTRKFSCLALDFKGKAFSFSAGFCGRFEIFTNM